MNKTLLGPTVEDVFAKMRKHRPDWNAYGQSRDSAADLAARCALELAAEHTAVAVAEERERCAKIVDIPPGTEAWEVIGGEEGLTMLRELAAQIRKGLTFKTGA